MNFADGNETALKLLKPGPDELGWWLVITIPIRFATAIFTSRLLEEPGWRGFALVELQRRLPREPASLVVGSYWLLWHQPMNIAFDVYPSLHGYVSMVAASFVIDSIQPFGPEPPGPDARAPGLG
ncbi:MAG: CPBP family glutamic-type intramembrane protease [Bacillota bacterium]|nr:CPBP family glutamic-type intramembrane protease [Bacillota bacterium]